MRLSTKHAAPSQMLAAYDSADMVAMASCGAQGSIAVVVCVGGGRGGGSGAGGGGGSFWWATDGELRS